MTRSIERAVRLMSWLASERADMGHAGSSLGEMAEGTGLDKATAMRIARSLGKFDLVRQDEQTRLYRLGAGAIRLGYEAIESHNLLARCIPTLKSVAAQTDETISLSERQGLNSVTIYEIESHQVVRYANTIGRSVPLHVAAGARVLLAFCEERILSELLTNPLEGFTQNTITEPGKLQDSLSATRRDGFSSSFGERTSGVHCIAAPVFSVGHDAIGSVSILWPSRSESLDRERHKVWPDLLRQSIEPLHEIYMESSF